jgi:hypothetical protein
MQGEAGNVNKSVFNSCKDFLFILIRCPDTVMTSTKELDATKVSDLCNRFRNSQYSCIVHDFMHL